MAEIIQHNPGLLLKSMHKLNYRQPVERFTPGTAKTNKFSQERITNEDL